MRTKRINVAICFLSGLIFANGVGALATGNYVMALLSLTAAGFGIYTVKNLRV